MTNALSKEKDEEVLMFHLRDILLREDRTTLSALKEVLEDKRLLAERISPIVEEHLEMMRQNFPMEYQKLVDKMIEQKLKDSQTQILEVIYPALGKMISKYISLQFQILKESIDEQTKKIFSSKNIMDKLRYRFSGGKTTDIILASVDVPLVEEIFIIQKNSGLLLGSAAMYPTENRDAVVGMLTAIKDFVEDAFQKDKEDLETISYGTYRVMLSSFPTYYFALALRGSLSASESEKFKSDILNFVEMNPQLNTNAIDDTIQTQISSLLEHHFISTQRGLKMKNSE